MTDMQKEKKEKGAKHDTASLPPETTGEKWFNRLRFGAGEVFILFLTAIIAYNARHVEKWGSIRNPLKRFQEGTEHFLYNTLGLGKNLVTSAFASTLVTYHGGNAFAPFMKWLHDCKETIVTWFNQRWGKPGEVEAGKERLRHEPKQTWWDVIKGRAAGFTVVFSSFVAAEAILGKSKKFPNKTKFDVYNDTFARAMTRWFTKSGKEIGKIPFGAEVSATRTYKFGELLALDIFATTASLAVWTTISSLSAKWRNAKRIKEDTESADPVVDIATKEAAAPTHAAFTDDKKHPAFTGKTQARRNIASRAPQDYRTRLQAGSNEPAMATL